MKDFALGLVLAVSMALPAFAQSQTTWDSIAAQLFGERALQDGSDVIAFDVPYRTQNDPRTDMAAQISAPTGLLIGKVWVVLDENPMPVSAIFEMDRPLPSFFFDITMRVNGPTPVHVVAETTDGQLFVAESYVKTSGTGACAAPPGTDPEIALLNMGKIEITAGNGLSQGLNSLTARLGRLDLDMSHPSHSGMQMDQITMLFVPMRYIEDVQIDLDGAGYVDMTGSISLSENPRIGLSVPRSTASVDVTLTDTEGFVAKAHKDLAGF